MISRLAPKMFSFVACSTLVFALGCQKEGPEDTAASETQVAPKVENAEGGADLEAAIAAEGPKTVTAIGAGGKSKVLAMGQATLAETDTYLVQASIPESAKTGAAGVVTINLVPKTGWKINQEFPTKLKVKVPAGVTLEKDTLAASDAGTFSEKAAVFELKFNGSSSGSKEFSAEFRFAVCTDATCDPKKADLAWKLDII